MHQYCEEQCEDGLDSDVDRNVLERDPQSVPYEWVVNCLGVVVETNKFWISEDVVFREAQVDAPNRGVEDEDSKPDQRGAHEDQRGQEVASLPLALEEPYQVTHC